MATEQDDKGQGTRDKGQGTRDKGQGTIKKLATYTLTLRGLRVVLLDGRAMKSGHLHGNCVHTLDALAVSLGADA
jgi:hypothetical protein